MAPKPQPNAAGTTSPSLTAAAASSKEGSEAPTPNKQSRNTSPSSTSGMPPSKSEPETASGPSPYGTRSRNRNGRARPNYAEDRDIDVDMVDVYPNRKDDGDSKKSTRQTVSSTNATQDAPRSAPLSSSTASSATAPQASKKRKAGVQSTSTTPSQATPAAPSTSASNAAQRKPSGGATGYPETNMMSFEDCKGRPKNGTLTADDGTVLAVNDHVYLICEPPGEPYYIGRIMEFLHSKNDTSNPVDSIRVNWFYRPKDMGRKSQDTRMLFATMHSDISPLNTLRGKCTVRHKAEIPNVDEYRKSPDCFWWDKMYDRYIQKNYDAIPTSQIINVPERVKKVLDERWKYVLVEQGRGKELTSAVKLCKRCSGYCASSDSVDCGFCKHTYHMQCVRPPLQKKPARGFGWACGPCNVAQERKLEALNAPHLHETLSHISAEDEELMEEEEEEDPAQANTNRTSPIVEEEHPPPTAEQIYQASLWPYRYLGMHCKIEDALDYDDRIYPRASSRLGPRHQATVSPWPGRRVQYVKPLEIKKTGRKDGRHSKEVQALIEKDKREREQRPKWVQDEPFSGYIPRGEDLPEDDPNCTSKCLWKPAEDQEDGHAKDTDGDIIMSEVSIDDYMDKARTMTKQLGVPDHCTNLEDIARDLLYKNNYDAEKSLQQLAKVDKSAFKEPELSAAEQKKFEEAVGKFGSELQSVRRFVKTVPHKWIVRYYYKWKKTPQGKKIWGNYSHRKGKKEIKRAQAEASKAADEVADDHDDSAFDTEKAKDKKKNFMCKFCNTKNSRQWRRAPGVTSAVVTETGSKSKDKGAQYVVALCRRCAELWRRYAIQWEDLEEVARKVAAAGGRAWKRKIDEELLKELQAANDRMRLTKYSTPEPSVAPPVATATPVAQSTAQEPPRKKLKSERDSEPVASDGGAGAAAAHYKCVLCPVESTEHDFVEPPRISHKKKTEKERERERLEKEIALKAADFYRKRQEDLGRPVNPREPLKRTADNNWVHVTCAVFHPEVKFGNAKALEPSEGIPSIPRALYQEVCKACGKQGGACVDCHNPNCRVKVHVECAYQHGYTLGFDITPVKGSRRDQHSIVSIAGESGTMTAAIWCKDHVPKTNVHRISDVVDESGINALQLYVRNFKQADLTLTGCARKAYLIPAAARTTGATAITTPANRRASTATILATSSPVQVNGASREDLPEIMQPVGKVCITCGTDVSPKWHPIDESQGRLLVNGHRGSLGAEAQKFVAQRNYQCHKCKKSNRRVEPPPVVKEETSPPPMPMIENSRASPQAVQAVSSPQNLMSQPPPQLAQPIAPPSMPHSLPPTMPPSMPPSLPPTMQPRGPPPGPPPHQYAPPQTPPYSDWRRPSSQHGSHPPPPPPPSHHMNGGHPQMPPSNLQPLAPPNHLRPPPLSSIHPPPPPLQNGHGYHHGPPPAINGMPPSPRSIGGPPPPLPNGGPYMPHYHQHHSAPHPPHHLTNGGPPPRAVEHPFSQALHSQRSPFSTPHGSPPMTRDSVVVNRDHNNQPPRAPETRQPSGASASPSLRNLLH
ncbi:hypothetical protein VSDG_07799 [Cytospora chrysosperma]|uniref:Uncharacterized protein n=1 Tax=Cytospora chrysosperma TaxID=252740 RepID=A0A423VJY6_CYTCH|nr:hypothetical protein VSDG_07799 [Valsa sordida]